MALIAKRPILYGSVLYQPGDALPAGDPRLMKAWLEVGSAALDAPQEPADEVGKRISDKPYDENTSATKLKELAKELGVKFAFGMSKVEMTAALDEAYAKLEAGFGQLIGAGTPPAGDPSQVDKLLPDPKLVEEATLKADLVQRMQDIPYEIAAAFFVFPDGDNTPLEVVKEAVERAEEAKAAEEAAKAAAGGDAE